jgi:putative ABC transport system permease protein
MFLWRQLARGLRALSNRAATDHEVADEVDDYVEHARAAYIARGFSPHDATRAARLDIGNVTAAREQVRSYGWENAIETLFGDLRFAARRLRTNPGFSIVAVITLALGIGATTAIFSAVNPILFEPLPYPHAERIAMISDVAADGTPLDVAFGTYRELVTRSRSFDATAVLKPWQPALVGSAEPERLNGERVGAGFFKALGVAPVLGRDFQPDDDRVDGPRVAILSDALWRRRFGSDSAILGRTVTLDDNSYQIIGVMPRGFENVLAPLGELWSPLQYSNSYTPDSREWGHHLRMVARLRSGVTFDQASRELSHIAHTPVPEFQRVPWASLKQGLLVSPLQQDVTRAIRPALLSVLGAVVLVLAIACVNVTNLLLARGANRRGEFAMRAALGADRSRLVRQLLTESLLLAVIGGLLGMVVAEFGVRAVLALSPAGLPRLNAIRVDMAVFVFGMAVTTLIGVLIGVIPAMHASREDLRVGLQHGSRRTAGGHRTTRSGLVVAEVAIALVLLVSAGLLLRSIERLFAVPTGFDPSHLLTMQVQESGRQFSDDSARYQFFDRALDAVRRVPGVESAAFTTLLPLTDQLDTYGVRFPDDRGPNDQDAALRYAVTTGYFQAMRIPLLRGRRLDERDVGRVPRAVMINESFAKRKFPGREALGQRLIFGPDDDRGSAGSQSDSAAGSAPRPWYTIVGIVGDVRQTSLSLGDENAIYLTPRQWHWADQVMSLVVRARGNAAALTPSVRRAIWSVDKNQPIVRIATMDELLARSQANRHFALVLFEAFGFVALVLAAVGIFGVLSGGVTERIREIGVRSALGASSGEILRLVLRQGMTLTGFGIVVGLVGAALASRALVTLLFGVSRLDPLTYVGVVTLLIGVALLASLAPAWRASRVDPAITLRAD